MSHRLARLPQHFLFRRPSTLPLEAGAFITKAASSIIITRFLSSDGKYKQMVDEVGEARKAAARQMEEAADAGSVSHSFILNPLVSGKEREGIRE